MSAAPIFIKQNRIADGMQRSLQHLTDFATMNDNQLNTNEAPLQADLIENDKMDALFEKLCSSSPKAQANRVDTRALVEMLISQRPSLCNVHGNGPMLLSDISENAKTHAVNMGIDEAGRGPVLGPMTYGAAFWAPCDEDAIPRGFHDSKALSPEVRSKLFDKTMQTPQLGFVLRVLHASEISRNMLRQEPYNLNAMSHDAAISMIRAVLDAGVKIDTCFVDTVGVADHYRAHLERVFGGHGIQFVVESKADAKYPTCSAASVGMYYCLFLRIMHHAMFTHLSVIVIVVAKVARDRMMETFQFTEPHYEADLDFGSGYPSDPKCKTWLEKNLQGNVFCFPDLVRFSWGPTKKALEQQVACEWEGDEEEEEEKKESQGIKRQALQMQAFMGKTKIKKKRKRSAYFETKGLSSVSVFHHG